MKTSRCVCGNTLFFENTQCLTCQRPVGFATDRLRMIALEHLDEKLLRASGRGETYYWCKNHDDYDVCNWLIPSQSGDTYCRSCQLNHLIPNLGDSRNLTLWFRMEQAKRRLLYNLFRLGLPILNRQQNPQQGLGFEFLQDEIQADGFNHELTVRQSVITGHASGMITLNLSEAEPSAREEMREQMNERYRTLLGHFRHESGHYFWDRLIRNSSYLSSFRKLFGDERIGYQESMAMHYSEGPPDNWESQWISAYASAHAWEDWAETWAHYLHMVATLETAHDFGFQIDGSLIASPEPKTEDFIPFYGPGSFDALAEDWGRLSTALNSLNRSMGMEDAYPFVIAPASLKKLRFVHRVVRASAA